MTTRPHLMLRFEAPLQAWGGVALDTARPTRHFPSQSGLSGLLANALGWTHRDGERINALQRAIVYGVREDRRPVLLEDYQTADLGREQKGWTRWGVESRGGAFKTGTQILRKEYLASGALVVALRLRQEAPVSLDAVQSALDSPWRPIFLGRRSCPPATRVAQGVCEATTVHDALQRWEFPGNEPLRGWWPIDEGPSDEAERFEVWDLRDFVTDNFTGSRTIVEGRVQRPAA